MSDDENTKNDNSSQIEETPVNSTENPPELSENLKRRTIRGNPSMSNISNGVKIISIGSVRLE